MRLTPYQLIPDKGSIGYKLYQQELKAKAEAAKVAAAPKPPAPKPTTNTTTTAKTAAPEKSAAEDTKLPKDGGAMDFFLNTAKVKYKEAGDRTKVEGITTLGGVSYSADEIRKSWDNPFVGLLKNDFMFIMNSLDSYNRHIEDVEKQQAKIADGDMSYLENLTMSQSMLADAKNRVVHKLEGLKRWAEENNTLPETQEFFGEYTEFTSGEKLSLQDLFTRFEIS